MHPVFHHVYVSRTNVLQKNPKELSWSKAKMLNTPEEPVEVRLRHRFGDDTVFFDFTRRLYEVFYRISKKLEEVDNKIDNVCRDENFNNYARSFLGEEYSRCEHQAYRRHRDDEDVIEGMAVGPPRFRAFWRA